MSVSFSELVSLMLTENCSSIQRSGPFWLKDCQAPELMLVGQAGVLETLEALEALMLLLSRTLGLTSEAEIVA